MDFRLYKSNELGPCSAPGMLRMGRRLFRRRAKRQGHDGALEDVQICCEASCAVRAALARVASRESSQYSRLEVRALQRQVRSAARSCRDQKQREANAGLNPRQCLVLLAVYILSGFDVLVAAEFLNAKADCEAMPKDEQEQFIEELYLRTDMEVLSRLQEPVKRSDVSVRREAVSFVARSKANAFVQKMNIEHGVAPTSLSTADQYLRHCERLGEPNLNRQLRDCVEHPRNTGSTGSRQRNLRKWCHRFRRRWSLKYRSLRPLEELPADEISKAPWPQ